MSEGLVARTLVNSFVDGPGNRYVVFLQGCNFNCLYCHNPETINLCNSCGVCVVTCPAGALQKADGLVTWQADICVSCDKCIEVCPYSSQPKAVSMTAREVVVGIKKYERYISGVTVGGGEPTQQPEFLADVLRLVKEETGLSTFVDSNGSASREVWELIRPYLDSTLIDLKAFDDTVHQKLTGWSNGQVLKSIELLSSWDKLYEIRLVIAPGYTDNMDNLRDTVKFLLSLDNEVGLKLIKFRPFGTKGEAKDWPVPEDSLIDAMVDEAKALGLKRVKRSL